MNRYYEEKLVSTVTKIRNTDRFNGMFILYEFSKDKFRKGVLVGIASQFIVTLAVLIAIALRAGGTQ